MTVQSKRRKKKKYIIYQFFLLFIESSVLKKNESTCENAKRETGRPSPLLNTLKYITIRAHMHMITHATDRHSHTHRHYNANTLNDRRTLQTLIKGRKF